MKFLVLTAVLVFALVLGANAQNRYSIQDRVAQLKDRLSLTDEQTAKVDSILTSARSKADSITATGPERRQAMRDIMMGANNDIEKILTDAQKTEYEKMLAERRNRMQNRPNRNN